ncbi:hypothetical protein GCM10025870_01330 [Agromyces marinus]|uniref:Bacterial toxin 24 domain-containing protein n=1 Tax=Agromyces marinus TaxID=1389020 RepID=A0ABM8GX39_9MICO|nr:hypothetical protein GCM10025870_01330 [Agromyces marinus]
MLVHNCSAGPTPPRGRAQDLARDVTATGDHTVFEMSAEGVVTRYQTFLMNELNPTGWQKGPRFRGTGGPHSGMHPPLWYPTGRGKALPGHEVPMEIPRGYLEGLD